MMIPYKYVSTINYACSTEAGRFLYGKKFFEVIPNAMRPLTQEMKNVVNGINSLIDILRPKENGGKDKK